MRAIYEGTAMGTRHILEDLRSTGFEAQAMYAAGGGTRSQVWMQIHADACQMPIYLTDESEATALGTAICAAHGAGLFESLEEAADRMVRSPVRSSPTTCGQHVRRTLRTLRRDLSTAQGPDARCCGGK
jgi:ribulose kinase